MSIWRIPLADIDLGEEEKTAVLKVLDRRWLTMGEETQHFEQEFADYIGATFACAVSNCTVALHLACLALGLGPGDEVLVPSLTFVATAAAVRYVGATPRFVEITSEKDFTISPQDIVNRITPRTRAIIVMHYGGFICDMPSILNIARQYNLFVIEDAAHSPGTSLEGRKAGIWGDIGCFSFFSNKNLSTGEGGMITTHRQDIAEKIRLLRSHGMTALTWDRHHGHAWSYDVVALGYNYRLDELRAAIGRVQLRKLDSNNQHRAELVAHYRERLREHSPAIEVPFEGHPGQSSYHLMPILLPHGTSRELFMEGMKRRGIQTSVHYPPIHQFSAYQGLALFQGNGLPLTESVANREVTLPLYPMLTKTQVDEVVEAVSEALAEAQFIP
ncbi:DegT/DnrJ/EryC1/StrS family aminotransferase [Thermanaerothrix sp.]|jgi:dTDP-4-amino-4,6-dideoxygalactose transaminase|uniref:DegT/DnrJ/EryC1/StrS family aminotransferase n=1 Tax=Thermanaerothrix sp. TaxID=2972675 RepID=UPI002ADD9B0A|nr:DegT/DnrJ/EryC1/StrS family aminotransferase [Thermanaerothrix sp.]